MADTDITRVRPTVLLTGPTRGLGRAMVDALTDHPRSPALVLAGRDPVALEAVAGHARARGTAPVLTLEVDLADLRSVARATTEVGELVRAGGLAPLTGVLANAGLQTTNRSSRSAQGHELTFAVDVLAQHALLTGLRPSLAADAHVLLLGSSTHRGRAAAWGLTPSPRWRDPRDLARPDTGPDGARASAGARAYADAKLALVTLAHVWARELAADGRRLNVYDPGLVPGTGLARTMPAAKRWTWEHVMPALRVLPGASSPGVSAQHAVALLLGDRLPALHDGYVLLGRRTRAHAATDDRARQERLWQVLEEMVEEGVRATAA